MATNKKVIKKYNTICNEICNDLYWEAQSRDRTKRVVQIVQLTSCLSMAPPIQIIANLTADCIVFI